MRGGGNIIKKIIGILICILFLFSTFPFTAGSDCNKNIENSFYLEFNLFYGKIINNGIEEIRDTKYHNLTLIDVTIILVNHYWDDVGFHVVKYKYDSGYYYFRVDTFLFHGILTKNYMFYYNLIFIPF